MKLHFKFRVEFVSVQTAFLPLPTGDPSHFYYRTLRSLRDFCIHDIFIAVVKNEA